MKHGLRSYHINSLGAFDRSLHWLLPSSALQLIMLIKTIQVYANYFALDQWPKENQIKAV